MGQAEDERIREVNGLLASEMMQKRLEQLADSVRRLGDRLVTVLIPEEGGAPVGSKVAYDGAAPLVVDIRNWANAVGRASDELEAYIDRLDI